MALFDENTGIIFLYPGIGVKPFGREQEFFLRYRELMQSYLQQGSAVAGIDLCAKLLNQTIFESDQISQEIFTYSFSCGVHDVLRAKGIRPRIVAGHSLGIYAALYGAEAIDFDEGLEVVVRAHRLGRYSCGEEKFGVGVVVGLSPVEVTSIISAQKLSSIHLANLNSQNSAVYVGFDDEIAKLICWAEKIGVIKAIKLRIDIPFHSGRFMVDATNGLHLFLGQRKWRRAICPVISALDGRLIQDPQSLKEMTAVNLSHTIDWPRVMHVAQGMRMGQVIECGAGLSLTQHARFISGSPKHFNLKNMRRRLDY